MSQYVDVGISSELLSSTLQDISGPAVDQLYKRSIFLDHAKKHGGIVYLNGSHTIVRPLAIAEHSNITELSGSGYNIVDMSSSDILTPASWRFCSASQPVNISRDEELSNRSKYEVVNLLTEKMNNVLGVFQREVERQIIKGDSTKLTSMATLNGGTSGGGSGDNKYLWRDTGVSTGAIGGVARASANGGLDNIYVANTDPVAALAEAWILAQDKSFQGKTQLILAGKTAFTDLKDSLFSQEQFYSKDSLDAGRLTLFHNGAAVEYSGWMPSDTEMFGINFASVKVYMDKKAEFTFSPFFQQPQQLVKSAQCHLRAQLVVDHLASQFVVDVA